MKRAKLTHMTLMAGLLLGSAASAEEAVTVTVDPTIEVTVDPVEEVVVDVTVPETPATSITPGIEPPQTAGNPAQAAAPSVATPAAPVSPAPVAAAPAAPTTEPARPTTPAQIVALRLQNTVQPRMTAADILAKRNGTSAPASTAPTPPATPAVTASAPGATPVPAAATAAAGSDAATTTAATNTQNSTPGTPDQATQQPTSAGSTGAAQAGTQTSPAPGGESSGSQTPNTSAQGTVNTQGGDLKLITTPQVPGQTLPVLNALSADRRVFAPTQARANDLSQSGPLQAQAFMTVTVGAGGQARGAIGYTVSNQSGVAGISDASRIRITLNGVDITGRLSRVNTSRQDGYLAPGTMETGVIDLDQLGEGELILEWRINTASTGGEQLLRYRWILVERTLNLPGARQ